VREKENGEKHSPSGRQKGPGSSFLDDIWGAEKPPFVRVQTAQFRSISVENV